MRRCLGELVRVDGPCLEHRAQRPSLVGPVANAESPLLPQLPCELAARSLSVRLIDEREVILETREHLGVAAQQRTLRRDQHLKRRLPPCELELRLDLGDVDLAVCEVTVQRVELELCERLDETRPLTDVREGVRVRSKRLDPGCEVIEAHRNRIAVVALQGIADALEASANASVGLLEAREASGNARNRTVGRHRIPVLALTLHAHERIVQVGDASTGAHILEGMLLQSSALQAAEGRIRIATRAGRRHELAERPVEDRRVEHLEALADVGQQLDLVAELLEGLELLHLRRTEDSIGLFAQLSQLALILVRAVARERLRIFEGQLCIAVGVEVGTVPRGVARAVLELTQLSGCRERLRSTRPLVGELHDALARQACLRLRRVRERRELRELAEAVDDRHLQLGVDTTQRDAVVAEHLAQADQRIVDVCHIRVCRTL